METEVNEPAIIRFIKHYKELASLRYDEGDATMYHYYNGVVDGAQKALRIIETGRWP